MNTYAVGDKITITGQIVDSRGPFNASGATAEGILVLSDFSAAAAGLTAEAITWTNDTLGEYSVTFASADTGTIVPGEYVLQITLDIGGEPVSWFSNAVTIRASNI